jgi:hypothetical protein
MAQRINIGQTSLYKYFEITQGGDYEIIDSESGDELFPLASRLLRSNTGRTPVNGFNTIHLEPRLYEVDEVPEYQSPFIKWSYGAVVGVFPSYENLILDPLDLTTGNWTATGINSRIVSSTLSYRDQWFTTIESDGAASDSNVSQTVGFASDGQKTVHIVVRQGTASNSELAVYDSDATVDRLRATIDWSTQTVNTPTGSIVQETWFGDNIVELYLETTSVTSANTNDLILYANDTGNTAQETTLYTAAQASDTRNIYPFKKGITTEDAFGYFFNWDEQATIEFWIHPLFSYDVADNVPILTSLDYNDSNFGLAYKNTGNFEVTIGDGSTTVTLTAGHNDTSWGSGNTFVSNTNLRKWIHFKIVYDLNAPEYRLFVNGTEIDNDTSTSLNIGNIGWFDGAIFFGNYTSTAGWYDVPISFMTDLLYQPYVDTSTEHYTNDIPYYSGDKLLGTDRLWHIDKLGNAYFNTVASVHGIAGAGITDHGENVNGRYALFDTGLAIIGGTESATIDISTSDPGSGYVSAEQTLNFPVELFINEWVANATITSGSQAQSIILSSSAKTTDTMTWLATSDSSQTSVDVTFDWLVIGLWKARS